MERPYVICHILSALNGRISGPFMSTPAAYRRYLKRKGVSYIQAGEDSLDCGIALEKLFRLFGICKLLVCGGGMIDWTFLKQGAVDELSLVLAPAASGEKGASVFDAYRAEETPGAVQFQLRQAETMEGGVVRLVYICSDEERRTGR